MALKQEKLQTILTKKWTEEKIASAAQKASAACEREDILPQNIEAYNRSLSVPQTSKLKKTFWYCVNDNPYIGIVICSAAACLLLVFINIYLGILGAFLGFVAGSFLCPAILKNCCVCRSMKSCKRIFGYTLSRRTHTEERMKENGVKIKVEVSEDIDYTVWECAKCGGRKIEILEMKRETIL